jgi:hypothetical protein
MYIWVGRGLAEDTLSEPKRTTLAMRPKPYLKLDGFDIDKASLTARLSGMVNNLANSVVLSWNSTQPIEVIRLIGHTDNTGTEKYNVGLGDRRAQAVAAELAKFKGLSSRVRMVVEPSPGETEPTADNRTREGRARNRRVEVFVTTGVVPPAPKKPMVDLRVRRLPPDPIIRTKPGPYWQPIPPGPPGKSLKEVLIELCKQHFPPRLCPGIVNRILNGGCSLLEQLFVRAGGTLSEKQKEDLRKLCRDATKRPIR